MVQRGVAQRGSLVGDKWVGGRWQEGSPESAGEEVPGEGREGIKLNKCSYSTWISPIRDHLDRSKSLYLLYIEPPNPVTNSITSDLQEVADVKQYLAAIDSSSFQLHACRLESPGFNSNFPQREPLNICTHHGEPV